MAPRRPHLQSITGWSEVHYGYIVTSFQLAYAIGLAVFGRLIDRYGTRTGYGLAMGLWSVAAMAHTAARSALAFGWPVLARARGVGELSLGDQGRRRVVSPKGAGAGDGPAQCRDERRGACRAAMIPWLTIRFGWPSAFLATGAIGFIWLIFWFALYEVPSGNVICEPRSSPTS